MAERKPISKKTRFEVFKRDRFTCQYCGRKAPDVLLHVDHIHPVKEGGTNDITNLITACSDCNLGKGARLLSDSEEMSKKHNQLAELQERREQLEMMYQWELSLVDSSDDSVERAVDLIIELTGRGLTDTGKAKIRSYISNFGISDVLDSIRIAFTQYKCDTFEDWENAFSKIYGICWNKNNKSCNSCIYSIKTSVKWKVRCSLDEDDEHAVSDAKECNLYMSKFDRTDDVVHQRCGKGLIHVIHKPEPVQEPCNSGWAKTLVCATCENVAGEVGEVTDIYNSYGALYQCSIDGSIVENSIFTDSDFNCSCYEPKAVAI